MALRIGLEQIGAEIILLGAKDFAGVVRSTEKDIDRLNSAVKGLEKESNSAFTSIEQVSVASLGAASIAIGLFVSAITAISGAAIKAAGDYDNSLQIVKGVTLGTDTEIKALDNTITTLSSNTRVNMKAAADAAGELARAGTDIKDQVGGALEAVLNLSIASAGELGLERAAVLTGSALKAFRLEGEDASRVVNAITVAAQNSAITFVDLQRSFQQAAPAASLFGLTVEDLSATLGVLGEQGIRGSDAGTALKQAFQQLVKPSKQGLDAMKEFGISLFDATGAARPFRDVIIDLEHAFGDEAIATGKLTEAQRAHALAVIFGSDAVRAGIVLSQRGVSAFDAFTEAMNDTTRSAASMAKIMQQSLNNQLQILLNNINILAVKFGAAFIPVLKEATANAILFARSLIPIANAVSTGISSALGGLALPPDFQDQLNNLVSPEAAAGINGFIELLRTVKSTAEDIVLPALGALNDAFNNLFGQAFNAEFITKAFQDISAAVITIGVVIATVAEQFTLLFSSIDNAAAFRDVLFAIAAVPIIAVAIGIGSIVVSIVSAIGPALLLAAAISAVVLAISQLDVVKNALNDIGKAAADIPVGIQAVSGDIQDALETPFEDAVDNIINILDDIDASVAVSNIEAAGPDITNALVDPFNIAALQIADILDAIDFPTGQVIPVGDLLPDSEVANVISNVDSINTSVKGLDLVFATVKDQAGQFITDLASTMEKENPRIGAFFSDFGTSANKLVIGTGQIFDIIGTNVRLTVDTLDTGFAIIMSSMLETSLVILESMKGISTGFDALLTGAQSFLVGWASLWNTVTTIAANAANVVVGIINGIGSALNGLANAQGQGDIFAGVPAVQIPKALVQIPGIVSNAGAAFDALGTRARAAIDSIGKKNDELVLKLQGVGGAGDELRRKLNRLSEDADTTAGSFDKLGGGKGGGGAKGAGKEIKDAIPAIEGFIDALTQAIRKQSFIDAFGEAGADAVDALIEAVVNNTDKQGAKAAEALTKFKQLLQKNNTTNFRELGEEADEAFANALIDRSDIAIQAAVDVVQKASDAIKAQGALTEDTFTNAFGLAHVATNLGSEGAKLLDSLKDAIIKGGTDVIKAAGAAANGLALTFFDKLPIDRARDFATQLMDGIRDVVINKTPETIAALQTLISRLNFDAAIEKLGIDRAKAINEATDKARDAINKVSADVIKAFNDLVAERDFKKSFDKQVKDIEDGNKALEDSLKDQQSIINTAAKRRREDADNQLKNDREDADRQEKLLADIVAARKNSGNRADKAVGPTAGAIQITSSTGSDDEIKKLQAKFDAETLLLNKKRAREVQDLKDKRLQEDADALKSQQDAKDLAALKTLLDKDVQTLKDQEDQRQFNIRVVELGLRAAADTEAQQQTLRDVKTTADQNFADASGKLTAQRALADTIMDGFLADQLTAIDNFTTMTSQFGAFDGTITFTSNSRQFQQQQSNDSPTTTGISSTPDKGFQKGGFVPGYGAKLIRAHGGEFVMSVEQVAMFERMFRANVDAGASSIRTNNYNVSASYQQIQSPASISEDLKALIALTS